MALSYQTASMNVRFQVFTMVTENCLLVYSAMRYGRNSIFRGEDGDRKIL